MASQRGSFALALVASAVFGVGTVRASLVSFTYNDLAADYVPTISGSPTLGGTFSANPVAIPDGLQTVGVVSRDVAVGGDAIFEPGFIAGSSMANFNLTMNVFNITGTGADSAGTFVVTDADGDTLSGLISGLAVDGRGWLELFPGMIAFNGILTNVVFTDNGAPDGTFDGSYSGSWDMTMPSPPPYEGALVNLTFGGPGLFTDSFNGVASSLTAQIIPAPGAAVLLAAGGLLAGRRRR